MNKTVRRKWLDSHETVSRDPGAVQYCTSESEAKRMREYLDARRRASGLELYPEKTRVVYCKDSN